MDTTLSNIAQTALLSSLTNKSSSVSSTSYPGINVPGTIVATLSSVNSTTNYMKKYACYNNYLTSNYGAAQQASDRYMSMKERIPMVLEYYLTPTTRKPIYMYINPEKLSVQTQKLKQPIITRGGIYFHHFGDDVWKISLNGQTGYSAMKQIEKLEEVYYYSGALLKFTNISASTLRTTQIQDSADSTTSSATNTADLLNTLSSQGDVGKSLASVIGTCTNAMGITQSTNDDNGMTTYEAGTGENFITKALKSADSIASSELGAKQSNIMKTTVQNTGGTNVGTFVGNVKNSLVNNLTNAQNSLSANNLIKGVVASALCGVGGGTGSSCQSIGKNFMSSLTGGTNNILGLLTGSTGSTSSDSDVELPAGSTAGNFYKLQNIAADDLASIVNSATEFTNNHTVTYDSIADKIGDLTSDLTDPYRPRMVFIYFDDRVFIGHFDSFNWDRGCENLSIQYQLQFTAVRQVVVGRGNVKQDNASDTLKNLAIGWGVNQIFSNI